MAKSKSESQTPVDLDYQGREIQPVDDPDDLQAARRALERTSRITPSPFGQHIYRILSVIALIIAVICFYAVGVMLWQTFF